MIKFLKLTIIWVSQNVAIPFWIVGHIHLTLNIYEDVIELGASIGMNVIVLVGFILDYRNNVKK